MRTLSAVWRASFFVDVSVCVPLWYLFVCVRTAPTNADARHCVHSEETIQGNCGRTHTNNNTNKTKKGAQ